jgi:hypothetical protein
VQLEDVWVLHQDGHEAEAMQAEAGATDGSQIAFALSVEGTAVGFMRAALMNATAGLLIGTQCHSALSMSSVGSPLIHAARNELAARGAKSLMALAPLHGLCEWIVTEKAWERLEKMPGFEPDQLSAVEAVAKGAPRPGQSVLDAETFKAAEPAFKYLATEFSARLMGDADSEVAMFGAAGAHVIGINWMHATDETALRDCAGCTATMHFSQV